VKQAVWRGDGGGAGEVVRQWVQLQLLAFNHQQRLRHLGRRDQGHQGSGPGAAAVAPPPPPFSVSNAVGFLRFVVELSLVETNANAHTNATATGTGTDADADADADATAAGTRASRDAYHVTSKYQPALGQRLANGGGSGCSTAAAGSAAAAAAGSAAAAAAAAPRRHARLRSPCMPHGGRADEAAAARSGLLHCRAALTSLARAFPGGEGASLALGADPRAKPVLRAVQRCVVGAVGLPPAALAFALRRAYGMPEDACLRPRQSAACAAAACGEDEVRRRSEPLAQRTTSAANHKRSEPLAQLTTGAVNNQNSEVTRRTTGTASR
jgi:hypothetical protein